MRILIFIWKLLKNFRAIWNHVKRKYKLQMQWKPVYVITLGQTFPSLTITEKSFENRTLKCDQYNVFRDYIKRMSQCKENFFLAPADFKASTLTCSSLPVVPVSAKMINDFTDNTICAGTVINYTCNAGGLNAFRVIVYYKIL